MPRNGSGTYSLPQPPFVPATPISSSAVNSDFSDIGTALTGSIAADGQTTITGSLKGYAGSVSFPGYTFSNDPDTGMYRIGSNNLGIAAGGTKIVDVSSTGVSITGTLSVSGTGWLPTAAIADKAVTYAKIQDISTNNRLLGRATSGAGVTEEVTVGTGLLITSTTLSAPAFPPPASYKNLSIKVATTTTVAVAADYVSVTDATNVLTLAFSNTINFATNGANGLDAGSIAINTWYYIFAIAKSDGTTACLASTSATSPTLPSGYTFKARIGAVRTISGSATLYGTWQFGNVAQYVVGLAQTTVLPVLISGTSGSVTSPTWTAQSVSALVPTTAGSIRLVLSAAGVTGTPVAVIAAPNGSYGAYNSTSNPPPLETGASIAGSSIYQSTRGDFVLESTNVYYASNSSNGGLFCFGWIDNL